MGLNPRRGAVAGSWGRFLGRGVVRARSLRAACPEAVCPIPERGDGRPHWGRDGLHGRKAAGRRFGPTDSSWRRVALEAEKPAMASGGFPVRPRKEHGFTGDSGEFGREARLCGQDPPRDPLREAGACSGRPRGGRGSVRSSARPPRFRRRSRDRVACLRTRVPPRPSERVGVSVTAGRALGGTKRLSFRHLSRPRCLLFLTK